MSVAGRGTSCYTQHDNMAELSMRSGSATKRLSAPEEVLAALSALLGTHYLEGEQQVRFQRNVPLDWSCIPWEPCKQIGDEGEEVPDIDFSSFPSLTLERSHGDELDSAVDRREDVEAHVSSLLSRPILVSNTTNEAIGDPRDEGGDMIEFIATKVSEVPQLMLQNFVNSFTTLMNSRLCAYATFLARHGLALLESSSASDDKLEEGIVGVEQKLETMLEIGRRVSTNAFATSFQVVKENGASVTHDDDAETCQVSMPLVMHAAIDISLSTMPSGGQHELVTVSFRANGNITGKLYHCCELNRSLP
jgi:hypothetical protein